MDKGRKRGPRLFLEKKAAPGSSESALQEGGTKKFGRLIRRDGGSVHGLGCGQSGLLGGAAGEARSNAARPQPVGHMLGYIH
jgi:hypothetical protein